MDTCKNSLSIPILTAILLISSQSISAPKTMTWQDSLKIAAENNEELKSSERSLQSSEYDVNGAYSTFFPQISGSLNYSGSSSVADGYSATLTATDNLFNGLQDAAKVTQAKASRDVAKTNYLSTRAKVSYDLKSAVANLLYAQNYVELTKNIAQRRELNLRTVQLRFESGRENKGALYLSKAYLEDARLDQMRARQNLYVSQSQFAKVLGEEEGEGFSFQGVLPMSEPVDESAIDFKSLVLQTPTYQQVVAQETSAEAGVTIAQAGFFPSLNVSATSGDYGAKWYPNDTHSSTLGVTLTLPLFNGGRDYSASRSARENLKASRFNSSNTLKDQLVKLKTAFVSFSQAVQKLKVDEAYVEALNLREKVSRQKYNNGLSTFDDWDIIENDLINRQKSRLVSERDRVINEAAWEQSQGKGVLP